MKQQRDKLCPYVNGVCDNQITGVVSGYCFIIESTCRHPLDYPKCENYKGEKKDG